ncbi:MAG: cytochrome c3 family protein [Coriobacteriia bacterium]|nr:cytochrome c3 family protein [Coriobacteriia bacterium]
MPDSIRTLPGQLLVLLSDPTSNLTAALILYGIIGLVVLILLLVAIMYLIATPEDDEFDADEASATSASGSEAPVRAPRQRPRRIPRVWTGRSVGIAAAAALAIVLGVWILAGFTTSPSAVCEGCHVESPHLASEEGQDPHASTSCVSCHEPDGPYGRYFSGVPSRLVHFADGAAESLVDHEYGKVTQSACLACHMSDVSQQTLNDKRGLKMSHTEPLKAQAKCLDCHKPIDGVVSIYNAGMNPCLQCHDSKKASSECATCHHKNASAAARARTTSFATVQIPDVKCGGCHDEKKDCDTCHGLRLPHTRVFMASAHARAGAVDFWYNGGRGCAQCHTATRRPCTKCHGPLLGKGHLPSNARDHRGAPAEACDRCHQRWAPNNSRDFCKDVCHSDIAIQGSPR